MESITISTKDKDLLTAARMLKVKSEFQSKLRHSNFPTSLIEEYTPFKSTKATNLFLKDMQNVWLSRKKPDERILLYEKILEDLKNE